MNAVTRANVYFNGKVANHSLKFADGSKKTLSLIYPGAFHSSTNLAERMEIVADACRVKLNGQSTWKSYDANRVF